MAGTTLRQGNKNIYWAWKSMKQRCQNPRCKAYRNYGGRGIGVCDRWQEFEPFCKWAIENGYSAGFEIDRIDNDGDYSPENCRWVCRRDNMNNRRRTILLTVNGTTKARTEWERCLNLPHGIVKSWVVTRGKEYAEQRIEEVIRCGYIEKDYSRNHERKPDLCIESGVIYPSRFAAAKAIGTNGGAIACAIARGGTAGGYHFRDAE